MSLVSALRGRGSLILIATLAAIVFGAVSAKSLPSGIYPDVDFPRIVVVAHVGDLPPEVVQTTATRPLEEAIATVPELRRLRSRTIRGATELSAQFAPGIDIWRTLQLVETHVAEVRGDLPADAEVRIERVTPTSLPIATFNVTGDVDPRVLREAAIYVLRPALTQVRGIGSVEHHRRRPARVRGHPPARRPGRRPPDPQPGGRQAGRPATASPRSAGPTPSTRC